MLRILIIILFGPNLNKKSIILVNQFFIVVRMNEYQICYPMLWFVVVHVIVSLHNRVDWCTLTHKTK